MSKKLDKERERIMGLTAAELDAEVAEKLMGYFWEGIQYRVLVAPEGSGHSRREVAYRGGNGNTVLFSGIQLPEYSTDYNACRAMEDELERRGLLAKYAWRLYAMTCPPELIETLNSHAKQQLVWGEGLAALLQATAEQRCRAALLVIENSNQ